MSMLVNREGLFFEEPGLEDRAVSDRRAAMSMYVPHDPVNKDFVFEDGMTRQEFADECDINVLMAKYEKQGILPYDPSRPPPNFVAADEFVDYQSALNLVMEAEASFMSLPANVRSTFENDPAKFVHFASDPANLEQMRQWGLAPPAPTPEPPAKVEIVNPPDANAK